MFVTGFMEMYKVIAKVCTSIFYLDYVVGMQFFDLKQVFSTHWAKPILIFGNQKMF
jgi:hypothetical protein